MTNPAGQTHLRARFIPNTVALAVYAVAGTLLTLIQVKLLSNYLSREAFGLFASFRGLALLVATLAANGIPALLVRFLPAHEAGRERRRALGLMAVSLAATLVLLSIALFAVHALRGRLFAFAPSAYLTPRFFFWFCVMTAGISLKLVVYGGLNGLRRLVHQVVIELLSLTAVLAWVYLARRTLDIELLFEIFGLVSMGTLLLSLPVTASFLVSLASAPSGDKRIGRREYMVYWYGAAGLSIVAVAFTDFDRYLLSQIVVLELLALFHIGSRVMKLANRLLSVPNLAFQPEITRLHEQGMADRVELSTRVLIKFNTAVSVLLLGMILLFAREIVLVVASPAYLGAVPLLILLSSSLPLSTMTAPLTTVMKAIDQVRGALYCDIAWAGVYLTLLFLFGARYGIMGVGIAHICACLAQLLLSLSISRLRLGAGFILGLGVRLVVSGAVACVPASLLRLVAGQAGASPAYIAAKIVLAMAGAVLFHLCVRWTRVFADGERAILRDLFEKRGLAPIGRLFT